MTKRASKLQSAHDIGVMTTANELFNQGWVVWADHVQGYRNPPTINGRVPDVYAKKNGWIRIIEIETDINDDPKQLTAFRRHAAHKYDTKFIGYIVNQAGRRVQQFS